MDKWDVREWKWKEEMIIKPDRPKEMQLWNDTAIFYNYNLSILLDR